jgi:transmembrane sensor
MVIDQKSDIPHEVTEAAAEWFDTLKQEPLAEDRRKAFVDWFMRSPVHVEEFIRVSALHDHLSSELKSQPDWLADVISGMETNIVNITDFEQQRVIHEEETVTQRWSWMKIAASIACIAILIGVMAGLTDVIRSNDNIEVIATTLGEQRSVLLDDGSVVQLNTDSRIRVKIDSTVRYVELLQGEAIFQVAKDKARPFQVDSGTVIVEAIGTRFNVYRQEEQVVVTVVEGIVAVSTVGTAEEELEQYSQQHVASRQENAIAPSRKQSDPIIQMKVGHQIAVSNDGTIHQLEAVNLDRVTAWTQRRLVFDNDTLETIVNEFNRYNRESLIVADPNLQSRRITGVFNANDPDVFLALLQSLGGVQIERTIDGSRQLSRLDFQQ